MTPASVAGPGGRTSSCASRRQTRRGPIRSKLSSLRYAPLSLATRTTESPRDGPQLQDHLRRRNAHARHPDVLAAQRRERARIRS